MSRSFRFVAVPIFFLCLLALSTTPGFAQTTSLELSVKADDPGLTISKYLYGHFAEHLGRCIYEGIWVGEGSAIANTNGIRNDVLAALKDLRIPVLRWPGGCFADEYHWRDGIGPRDQRPVRINTHWGWVEETNAFGTHEFFELVELLGADAYIAGNVGSGTPQEMAEWLEYMTATGNTELAELRRKNGREEPWKVAFFGVGNETWGCGGNMTPAYYADLYKRYATFLKGPDGNRPKKVASGGNDDHIDWTVALAVITWNIDGISHHYYTTPTGEWPVKGTAIGFPESQWISTLYNTMKIDGYIQRNKAVLEAANPQGNIGLYLDEWGTWYDPEPGREPGFLYQQNSLRDAVVAALNFNIFHRHADRLHMANIAQTVNVLQAMILTDGDKMLLTPTYHAFKMYIPFQGSVFIPSSFKTVPDYTVGDISVPQVSATTALGADGELVLGLVNLDPHRAARIVASISGFVLGAASGQVLTAGAMDAHNTFDDPDAVQPRPIEVEIQGGQVKVELPAKSVTVVKVARR